MTFYNQIRPQSGAVYITLDHTSPVDMKRYDPMQSPIAKEWLELSQSGHISRIESYHRQTNAHCEDLPMHVTLHLAIENQLLAPGGAVVRDTLDRLIESGLDRHAALHAIGAIYRRFEIGDEFPRPHPDAIDWDAYETKLRALGKNDHGVV